MQSIHYGSLFLDSETAVLFFAVAFICWLFKCNRVAAAVAAAGFWLAFSPWLEPLFIDAFAHVPWWVPILIVLFALSRFAGAIVNAFFGQRFARELMVHTLAPVLSDLLRACYRVPLYFLKICLLTGAKILGTAIAVGARAAIAWLAPNR